MTGVQTCALPISIRAQKALHALAGEGPEMFPIEAFVGMISDEIQTLREQGHSEPF